MKPTSTFFSLAVLSLLVLLALDAWRPQPGMSAVQAAAQAIAPSGAAPSQSGAEIPAGEDACVTGRSVQVSGAAVINVTPDRVLLQLGVQSNGTSPDAVQNDNMKEIQKVINAVRALGVETRDIATDYYIVYPVYEDYNALAIKGYRLDNTVSITLRDINLADDVILAALRAGANEVQDVQFYTSELRKYRDQARALAMQAAGEKASALSNSAGAQAGCVLSISENTWSQYYGSWRGGRATTLWAQNTIQNAAPQGQPTPGDDSPISLGQIAVRAEIDATYSLK